MFLEYAIYRMFDNGIKYLGLFLKNDYRVKDWNWLYEIIEGRVTKWCYIWLSRGGILTLVKLF